MFELLVNSPGVECWEVARFSKHVEQTHTGSRQEYFKLGPFIRNLAEMQPVLVRLGFGIDAGFFQKEFLSRRNLSQTVTPRTASGSKLCTAS